jgi:GNAT superfamily N-acetyltransferase
MHRVRTKVRENRLSDAKRITEAAYLPYVTAGTAWVAEEDAAIVGFAAIDPWGKTVWALFIQSSAEGSGVGRALHDKMLRWAREHGIEHLTLSTEGGSRAINFYIRAGRQQQGVTASGEVVFSKAHSIKSTLSCHRFLHAPNPSLRTKQDGRHRPSCSAAAY